MNDKLITRDYAVTLETREENGIGVVDGRPIVNESMTKI